jgi:selenocysteine lyase/cysteine desulfurase
MLDCQKDLFQLDDDVIYLNCAYMSPQLKSVEMVGRLALAQKNKPWTITASDFFEPVEALKKTFSKLINNSEPARIAIVPSASYGMASAARNVPMQSGQKILVVEEQFPSNYYSWDRLCQERGGKMEVITATDSIRRSETWNEKIIAAIDEQVVVVALGHVHWADGTLFDLEAIREACDRVGAYLIIDGTQSVGALPFDVQKIRPDALICAGYKWLLGPYSLGVAYYGPRFDNGIPIEENWINRHNSDQFTGLVSYEPRYQPGAGRYSMGQQSNFMLVPQLTAAIQQLNAWQPKRIQAYCQYISEEALQLLQSFGCQIDQSEKVAHHLRGVRLSQNMDADLLQQKLKARNIHVSKRGNAIRIAPHVYNTDAEMKCLVGAFMEASLVK